MTDEWKTTPDGYLFGAYKTDRIGLDPYLGVIRTPDNIGYTTLAATMAKALQWCRERIVTLRNETSQPHCHK